MKETLITLIIIGLICRHIYKKVNEEDNKEYRSEEQYNTTKRNYNRNQYSQNYNYSTGYDKEADIIKKNYIQTALLTPTELKFYKQLKEAMKYYDIEIHYKVRLADIFRVKYHNKYYDKNFAKIMAKHTDFLIVEPDTAMPIIAIELDDPSHDSLESVKSDNFKNTLYATSNIRLYRFKVGEEYNFNELKQTLKRYLNVSSVTDKIKEERIKQQEDQIKQKKSYIEYIPDFITENEPKSLYDEISKK